MKNNKGSSIYEVLRTATRSGGEAAPASAETPAGSGAAPPEAGAATTLQERLAAYKAAKLAEVVPAAASEMKESAPAEREASVSTATPPPMPRLAPPPVVSSTYAPPPSTTPVPRGPGERVVRLTYNTAVFTALVGIGLLFVAYAIGLQAGRARASGEAALDRAVAPPPAVVKGALEAAPPPAPPPKTYSLLLTEWPARTRQETVKAEVEAEGMRRALASAGLGQADARKVKRGGEDRLALYLGQYTNLNSDAARKKFEAVQKFKQAGKSPFAKAEFEEVSTR